MIGIKRQNDIQEDDQDRRFPPHGLLNGQLPFLERKSKMLSNSTAEKKNEKSQLPNVQVSFQTFSMRVY